MADLQVVSLKAQKVRFTHNRFNVSVSNSNNTSFSPFLAFIQSLLCEFSFSTDAPQGSFRRANCNITFLSANS